MDGQATQNQAAAQQPYYPTSSSKKRIIIIVGIVLLFLSVAVGITALLFRGGGEEAESGELTYWGLWEDEATFAQVVSDFERENPGIKVKYEKQDITTVGKYVDRLTTRINNGTGPDLFRFHNTWVPQLHGVLLPLPNSVLEETGFKEQYYQVIQDDMEYRGAYYGIPLGIDTLSLFINDEMFTAAGLEPPTTWEDLAETARELTIKNSESSQIETAGAALGTYDNITHAPDIVSLLFLQNGADIYNLNGDRKINAEQTLEFYTSFAKGTNTIWDSNMDNSKLAFAKGSVAMYFGYSWDILEIKGVNPDLQFSIVPVPHLPGRNETVASYWVEGVSAKSKSPKAAFKFLSYLSKRESLTKIFEAQAKSRLIGVPYPRADMADLLKTNELLYPFVSQAGAAKSSIFVSDTHDDFWISSLNIALGNAVNEVLSGSSPETANEKLASEVNRYKEFLNGK